MKIVVVGAGALGAYFGARWHEAGNDVRFLVRERRRNQLLEHGLVIHSPQGDYRLEEPKLITNTDEVDRADLVFLSVKSYHMDANLVATLKKLVEKGAKVLPVLNGVTHIDALQSELGEEAVLGGLCHIISTLDEKGHVVHSSEQHDLTFGPFHPSQQAFCEQLHQTFEKSNMHSILSDEIQLNLWLKYTFINAFSGVTTAGDLNIGLIRACHPTMELGKSVLIEMKNLANAYGVNLTDQHVENAVAQLQRFPEQGTSSMHRDKQKGLPLEVEHLLGGALKLAEQKSMQLPAIQVLYALIKPHENGKRTVVHQ